MADWRNPEDYAYTQKSGLHDWAWEFLRRNSSYVNAWNAYQDAEDSYKVRHHDVLFLTPSEFDDLEESEYDKVATERVEVDILMEAASYSWGLTRPVDPSWPGIPNRDIRWRDSVSVLYLNYGSLDYPLVPVTEEQRARAHLVAVELDLTQPLGEQVQALEHSLRWRRSRLVRAGLIKPRKPTTRVQWKRYPLLIRSLDAVAMNASQSHIGSVLFSEHKEPRYAAKSAIAAARKMSSGGYRDLLLMANRRIS